MPKKMVINHKIRLATSSDCQNIARIAIETYVETYGARGAHGIDNRAKANKLYGHDYVTKFLPDLLGDKAQIIAVALASNKIIGYAKLTMQPDKIALLDKLYILKKHQRKGYGRALLQFCYQKALEQDMSHGKLLVYIKNENAIQFYEANGFDRTGDQEPYFLPNGKPSKTLNEVMCADIHSILKSITSSKAPSKPPSQLRFFSENVENDRKRKYTDSESPQKSEASCS